MCSLVSREGLLVALLQDGTNWAESRAEAEASQVFLTCLACTCMSLCLRDPPRAAAEHKGVIIRWFRKTIGNSPGKGERAPIVLHWPSTCRAR